MAKQNNIKFNKGFTIIEVVLVLAVAGLIFMMVSLALLALQRSQKDTQRRDQLSGLVNQIIQYQSNNRNKLPVDAPTNTIDVDPDVAGWDTNATGWAAFYKNYILAGGDVFEDPNGVAYKLEVVTCAITGNANGTACGTQRLNSTFEDQNYKILITYKSTCDGENIVYNTGARKVTVAYKLEGGGTFCQGN